MSVEIKYFGNAGHLCVGHYCRFHLCTLVGEYLVSTVGEYFPDSQVREINARFRNIELAGMGDEREADYMQKVGFEEIGFGRLYETMVFRAGELCECGCGMPTTNGSEEDMAGYMTAAEATEGHREFVEKWKLWQEQR